MRMSFYLLLLIVICTISCNKKEREVVTIYASKNIESIKFYYNDTLIKTTAYYDTIVTLKYKEIFHKERSDSLAFYYKNGTLFKTGTIAGAKYGKWHHYAKNGILSETSEFMIIKNKSKLNQIWFYNQKGDTLYYGNNSFNIYDQKEFIGNQNRDKRSIFVDFYWMPLSDTLSISEPLKAVAADAHPFWRNKGSESYIVIGRENFNFNKDFSNESEAKTDTFFCLEKDMKNKVNFPNYNQRHTVAFGRYFTTPGKKIIRGFMEERYRPNPVKADKIVQETRRTYFEKTIYVKDTI